MADYMDAAGIEAEPRRIAEQPMDRLAAAGNDIGKRCFRRQRIANGGKVIAPVSEGGGEIGELILGPAFPIAAMDEHHQGRKIILGRIDVEFLARMDAIDEVEQSGPFPANGIAYGIGACRARVAQGLKRWAAHLVLVIKGVLVVAAVNEGHVFLWAFFFQVSWAFPNISAEDGEQAVPCQVGGSRHEGNRADRVAPFIILIYE